MENGRHGAIYSCFRHYMETVVSLTPPPLDPRGKIRRHSLNKSLGEHWREKFLAPPGIEPRTLGRVAGTLATVENDG